MKKIICSLVLVGILFVSCSTISATTFGGGEIDANNKVIATFQIKSIKISKDGMLSWTAEEEQGSLPYYVEQFLFNKWVVVAQVDGVGTPVPNSYSVPLVLSTGENIYRIRQKGYDKISRFSNSINYYSKKKAVSYKVINHNQAIEFSADTYFVIYNPFGVIVKQGYGNSADISEYSQGYYCLVYDNKLGGFEKKKVLFKNTPFSIVLTAPDFFKRYQKQRSARNPYSRFKIN